MDIKLPAGDGSPAVAKIQKQAAKLFAGGDMLLVRDAGPSVAVRNVAL
jgi:hypothetical protein